jgi:hypothetical protein
MLVPDKWLATCGGTKYQIHILTRPGHHFRAQWYCVEDFKVNGGVISPVIATKNMPEEEKRRTVESLIKECMAEIARGGRCKIDHITQPTAIRSSAPQSGP